jgi:hypothetical protein
MKAKNADELDSIQNILIVIREIGGTNMCKMNNIWIMELSEKRMCWRMDKNV